MSSYCSESEMDMSNWSRKHLLSIEELTSGEIERILKYTEKGDIRPAEEIWNYFLLR